ncbi:nicotinamide mononucleotide deamidase-related protein YfaY [Pantoea sp. 1.19]|uniref:nicotinamide mononucleotide deamidase-related protein YfaY n=1 Tax=Pantoea sp. 1.19 TaxID=1925589 RepID=UPI000948AC19|nr:nicotinamide mononucleotide deamidase-related protein YfaY [Pantoea sp. 1.19]
MIRVEMLATGDEVLHGQIVDTNAAWLADTLFERGLPMRSRTTVGDALPDLVAALIDRSQQADVLIVNGGLGPTSDDLSAQAAAQAAGVPLELHAGWLAEMEAWFARRGRAMAASNRKQAEIPQGAEMINNPVGTACGFALRLNRCWLFFTPGVPSEFKKMVTDEIIPRLQQHYTLGDPPLCLRLTTFGRGESDLASELDRLALPDGVVLGYRSSMPIIELKLTGPASQRPRMEALFQQVRDIAGESLIFEGTVGLPARLARLLDARGLRLRVSEQFTAGLLQWQLASGAVALERGEVLAEGPVSLRALAARTAASGAALALSIGTLDDAGVLALALHTPEGGWALRVRLPVQQHSRRIQQETAAMLAMNLLRRWLLQMDPGAGEGWVDVLETLRS